MKKVLYTFMAGTLLLASCGQGSEQGDAQQDNNSDSTAGVAIEDEQPIQELSLEPMEASPEFPEAELIMNTPADKATLPSGDSVAFDYTVNNYELAVQTSDAEGKCCANSDKGQHIHLILNNEPYSAHYNASFKKKLDDGHYVALSFVSRSYHESIKNGTAHQLVQFDVGDPDGTDIDLSAPHMFYSRPKGIYRGNECDQVMLDFFLANTTLAADGNKVRATINGKEFMIDTWQPYVIKGLPMGESSIKLELLDAEGNLVSSPYNPVERSITLTDQ